MSDYRFDPGESSLLYPFIRSLATDSHAFSKEEIDEINDCFVCLENWFGMFLKKIRTDKDGNYKPYYRYRWVPKNKIISTEEYIENDIEHLINETLLEDWINDEIVYYEEVEVEHNHGPQPYNCYGPWHDIITYSTEWSFYEWDASELHDFLRNFKNMSKREKYNFIINYV